MTEKQLQVAKRLFSIGRPNEGWADASEELRQRHLTLAWVALDEACNPTESMIEAGCAVDQARPIGPRTVAAFVAMLRIAAPEGAFLRVIEA